MTKGIIAGLVALVMGVSSMAGCDKNKKEVMDTCNIGNVQVRLVYNQVRWDIDYISLEFYREGKLVSAIENPLPDSWLKCDDGRKLSSSGGCSAKGHYQGFKK